MDAEQADRKQLLACRMVRYKALYPNAVEAMESTTTIATTTTTEKPATDGAAQVDANNTTPANPPASSDASTDQIPSMSADIKAALDIPAEHLKDPKFDCLFESYKPSFELMEALTQKLVMWEQKFGCYGNE